MKCYDFFQISIHLDLIVDELMRGMTHMLWRVRQSSCMAFVDIFRIGIMLQVDTKENTGKFQTHVMCTSHFSSCCC